MEAKKCILLWLTWHPPAVQAEGFVHLLLYYTGKCSSLAHLHGIWNPGSNKAWKGGLGASLLLQEAWEGTKTNSPCQNKFPMPTAWAAHGSGHAHGTCVCCHQFVYECVVLAPCNWSIRKLRKMEVSAERFLDGAFICIPVG